MKTEIIRVPRSTIETFAEQHALTMEVREMSPARWRNYTFTASFRRAEVMDNGFLDFVYGTGNSPEEAIASYADRISLKRLAIDAYSPDRREIAVPLLTPGAP